MYNLIELKDQRDQDDQDDDPMLGSGKLFLIWQSFGGRWSVPDLKSCGRRYDAIHFIDI